MVNLDLFKPNMFGEKIKTEEKKGRSGLGIDKWNTCANFQDLLKMAWTLDFGAEICVSCVLILAFDT